MIGSLRVHDQQHASVDHTDRLVSILTVVHSVIESLEAIEVQKDSRRIDEVDEPRRWSPPSGRPIESRSYGFPVLSSNAYLARGERRPTADAANDQDDVGASRLRSLGEISGQMAERAAFVDGTPEAPS